MRDYAKLSPRFWTGETGRAIRDAGRDAQVLALYLLTGPSSNMIGLYYLPIPTLCHETGLTKKGACKALQRLSEAGFARWDECSEQVFVPEMAAHQIGEPLQATDNRVKGIAKDWQSMRKSPFYMDFYWRYRDSYHLPAPLPQEAPSKPLRSQEKEQEQEISPSQGLELDSQVSAGATVIALGRAGR
jgi:hypothetical protein